MLKVVNKRLLLEVVTLGQNCNSNNKVLALKLCIIAISWANSILQYAEKKHCRYELLLILNTNLTD